MCVDSGAATASAENAKLIGSLRVELIDVNRASSEMLVTNGCRIHIMSISLAYTKKDITHDKVCALKMIASNGKCMTDTHDCYGACRCMHVCMCVFMYG